MTNQIKITSQSNYLAEALLSSGQFQLSNSAKLEIVDSESYVEVNSLKFTKPLILKDLISAINNAIIPEKIEFKEFTLLPKLRSIHIQKDEISLTEKEVAILLYLIDSTNHTSNKASMLKEIWGANEQIETKTIESHVYRLRQKLETYHLKNWLTLENDSVILTLTML